MTCIWTGLRFPFVAMARFWRCQRARRTPMLDPRTLNAHWRRDLGFD
jgi:hypothetical protein